MVQNPTTSEYARRVPAGLAAVSIWARLIVVPCCFQEDAIGIRLRLPNPPPIAVREGGRSTRSACLRRSLSQYASSPDSRDRPQGAEKGPLPAPLVLRHRQHHAEASVAAHHPRVGLRCPRERHCLNHRTYAREHAARKGGSISWVAVRGYRPHRSTVTTQIRRDSSTGSLSALANGQVRH